MTGVQNNMLAGSQSSQLQRSQPEPIRVGVIGVGNMGQHHTRVLSMLKDVELVGVSDINMERGIDTASKYRVRFLKTIAICCRTLMQYVWQCQRACTTPWG